MQKLFDLFVENRNAITGAVLLAFLGSFLVWRNNKKSRQANACIKFRSEILREFAGLYPIPSEWPKPDWLIKTILESKFPTIQAAIHEFRPNLNPAKQLFFDRAWKLYLNGSGWRHKNQENYWHYVPGSGFGTENGKRISHDTRLTYKEDFKINVTRLLSFAKDA